jgi:hypothetical protein
MKTISYTGRSDGAVIRLDEQMRLPPNTAVLVTILPLDDRNEELEEWRQLAMNGLAAAYGPCEPEYSLDQIKTPNSSYAGG